MEYDRALYRVYERIMEDLNSSPSPMMAYFSTLASTPSDRAPVVSAPGYHRRPRRSRRRRYITTHDDPNNDEGDRILSNTVMAAGENSSSNNQQGLTSSEGAMSTNADTNTSTDDNEGVEESTNLLTANSGGRNSDSRRRSRENRGRRRQQGLRGVRSQQIPNLFNNSMAASMQSYSQRTPSLPFFLPIWMSLKLDKIVHHLYSVSVSAHGTMMRTPDELNSGRVASLLRIVSGVFARSAGSPDHNNGISSPTIRYSFLRTRITSARSSSRHGSDDDGIDIIAEVFEAEHNDTLQVSVLSADDNSRDGLRRRTASNSSSSTPSRSHSSPSNSPSNRSSASSTSSPRNTPTRVAGQPLSLPRSPARQLMPYSESLQPRTIIPPPPIFDSDRYTYTSSSEETSASDNNRRNNITQREQVRVVSTTSLTQRAIELQLRHSERIQSSLQRDQRNQIHEDSDSEVASVSESVDGDSESDEESTSNVTESRYHERGGCSQQTLYRVMRISFGIGVLHIIILLALHVTYVGPYAFQRQKKISRDGRTGGVSTANYNDHLVNCIANVLSTRPPERRSKYNALFGSGESNDSNKRSLLKMNILDFDIDDEWPQNVSIVDWDSYNYDDDPSERRFLEEISLPVVSDQVPLLGLDEILQIKILYGKKCSDCSQVRYVQYLNTDESEREEWMKQPKKPVRLFHELHVPSKMMELDLGQTRPGNLRGYDQSNIRRLSNETSQFLEHNDTSDIGRAINQTNTENQSVDELSSPTFWDDPHYRFSLDGALLYLDEKSIYLHNITIVNVTVTERCLSTGSDDGELSVLTAAGEFLSQIYGMDSVIINQLIFGMRSVNGLPQGGHVQSMETKERWGWRKDQIEPYDGKSTFIEWLIKKLGILFMSLLAFFLITSVTSLIVRVLTSSGVVLMFPLFECFRRLGVPGADERILALSYPWIGAARRAIRSSNTHPQSHLVLAHVTKIVLYYVMYEACQAAWSVVLYAKSIPEALPVWIYGLAMITEYFTMVFVRSALSVHFFPRITLLYFLLYHFYFYSVPYGYFDVALIPFSMFLMHAMTYTIFLEAPNSSRGTVSIECPREVYNKLSWPEWNAQLPSEWTIFLPLNSRQTPLHDRQIPQTDTLPIQVNDSLIT